MATPRLTTALDDGLLSLPDGPIAVVRPPSGYDLAALPRDQVHIQHSFMPDLSYWQASGYAVEANARPVAALVVVPRSKSLARSLIAQAAAQAPLVIVDGQRTDGIDSLFKDMRKRIGDIPSLPKAHGRLFWFESPGALPEWEAEPAVGAHGYVTQPGVFAEAGPDKGSVLLLAALPAKLPRRIADLGAGWGYLSAEVLKRYADIATLDLVEAEALALDCARQNVTDPRARFHWADATRWDSDAPYDAVVSNPPFHTSREGDPGLGQAFIAAAARLLTPQGHLWLVANRHLPYESTLSDHFIRVEETGGDGAFKVFHAHRPKKR